MTGKTISHYKILAKLGQGGMGVVYKAEDLKLKRIIALKFLPPSLTADPEAKERFIQEAQAASALEHPNICNIHEINETDDGQLYMVMACYEGQTLKEKLTHGALPIENAMDVAEQIANGLSQAHAKGIVHRDIKPANIFITNDATVKILDFGLAKLAGQTLHTKTGSTLGTVAYMSPEQAQGLAVDHRTDIWSLGVILYEMLSGQQPFVAEYDQAILYRIVNQEPDSLQNYCAGISSALAEVITGALQKKPDNRYQSIREFKAALQEATGPTSDGKIRVSFKAKPAAKHNLPTLLTSFVGREQEINEVKTLLQEHRLVTLTGAGGCGKTRLAIKIAGDLVNQYQDGVFLVELASVTDPKLLSHVIAEALEIKEELDIPVLQTVMKQLQDKQLLLLIDNCEHLVATCSQVVESLLKFSPTLSVMTTSRESLNIAGETVWKVPSLCVPDETKPWSPDQLVHFDAVNLFIERAKDSCSTFVFAEQNAETITKICCRLDGIPLAIELAAARIRSLNPEEILKRLYDRFHLLTGGSRTALERQKTLQATVDWSYALLSESEKLLFNRLSVFVGGCNLEAIETVCTGSPIAREQIVELVSSLIDKSLVISLSEKEGNYRYRLLETLRLYAGQKLLESEEAAIYHDRHFEYYLNLAEQAYENQFGYESMWADRLEIDHENLITALEWVKEKPQQRLVLSGALAWFWGIHTHFQMGIDYLQNAIQRALEENADYARALFGMGWFYTYLCRFTEALPYLEKSLAIWRALNREKEIGLVLFTLGGKILESSTEVSPFIKYYEESLAIFQRIGEDRLAFRSQIYLTAALIYAFNADRAEPLVKANLSKAGELNLQWEMMVNRHFFADCALIKKDYHIGEKRYAEAMQEAIGLGDIRQAAVEMQGMAMNIAGQKRFVKALRLNAAATKKFEEIGFISNIYFWNVLLSRTITPAREIMGPQATAIAEAEGRQMGFEKACEYALDFDKD